MDPDRLLDGLNDAQRRAVTSAVVPLCILAGAGSGKTRVLTRRIAYRAATEQHDPRRVLALTFTRKAAGELGARLRQLGLRDSVVAGTFHAVAYAQLRSRWAVRNINPPTLLDRKVGFVARLMPANSGASRGVRDAALLDVVTEIEWAKARRVTPEHYPSAAKAARRRAPLEPRQIAEIFERYEQAKRDRRMVDFDDLLSLCTRDLNRDETFANAQRWSHRHFFVDEYQDVNPLQQGLLEAWLGDRSDLCVVGDPNQAIYSWNGADAKYLNDFTDKWNRGEVVRLSDNYRSSPQVLAVANAVLAGSLSRRRAAKSGDARGDDHERAEDGLGMLRPNHPDGPTPTVRSYADDRAEARGIARSARDHHHPHSSWSSQAVLVRTNAQISVIEDTFRKASIPFRVKGGASLLDQAEVKAALSELKGRRGPFAPALTDLEVMAASGFGQRQIQGDAGNGGDGALAEADSRQANMDALVRLGHDFLAIDPSATTGGFLGWLADTNRSDQPESPGDAIDVMTFHSAKGLEWPIVHIGGLEQGLVPIGHAQTPAALAEERRLFYVAATRAENVLSCSWAETRTFGTRVASREPSPFLAQVTTACEAIESANVPADWAAFFRDRAGAESGDERISRKPVNKSGRIAGALSMLDEGDRELFDALKHWRAGVARAASVPAFVVFHDATLQAIASTRPGSTDDLLKVTGVGPVKVTRYGEGLLEVVADYAE